MLDSMLVEGGVLVQKFLPEVMDDGEWSIVFLQDTYSHAVRKRPRPGEFLVQEEYGGTAERAEPSPDMLETARRAVAAVGNATLYARVDGVVTGGELQLMELELIEPWLYLSNDPGAAQRFAEAIVETMR